MATRWPTDILQIGDPARSVWGQVYEVTETTDLDDALGDDLLPKSQRARTYTATAEIRGGAAVIGERLTDPNGEQWVIVAVRPSDNRWRGGTALDLQQPVIVEK